MNIKKGLSLILFHKSNSETNLKLNGMVYYVFITVGSAKCASHDMSISLRLKKILKKNLSPHSLTAVLIK